MKDMYENTPSNVLKHVIKDFNTKYEKVLKMKMKFDELSVRDSSLCLTTSVDSDINEKLCDVTGNYMGVSMNLTLIYRVCSTRTNSSEHLNYISTLDDIYEKLKSVFTGIKLDNAYVDSVSLLHGAKLDMTYDGGIKDFKLMFSVYYERRI